MTDLSDFRNDDVVVFGDEFGIAISKKKGRAIVFKKTGHGYQPWTIAGQLPLEKVRSVGRVDGVAEKSEYFVVGRGLSGSANAVGAAVGSSIKDALAAAKARRETGLVFELGWMDEPEIFVGLSDNKKRLQVVECCRQIFAGDDPEGSVRIIPEKVALSFPTKEMLERDKQDNVEKNARIRRLLISAAVAAPVVIALVVFNLMQSENERLSENAMRSYISTFQSKPATLDLAQGETCDRLKLGYETVFKREGTDVTHIVGDSVSMPRVNESFVPNISSGLVVVIDDQDNTVRVTRNLHYYVNDGRPSILAQPLPIPAGTKNQFVQLVEPAC
ncbi:MAG: hypothetical protein AAF192_11640 [Pseudomonadota bacterium]